jgi:hypothetical protein
MSDLLQAGRLERLTILWATEQRWSDGMDSRAAKIEAALEAKPARRIDEPGGTEHIPMTS